MGKYSVPEEIRKLKPKGTMVKNISGHYYVYEFSNYTDENGKRKTKMGKSIGVIKPQIGFVPNKTHISSSEITTLEFGNYAAVVANSQKCLELLKQHFNPEDAVTIYTVALIHFINNFTHIKDVKKYYDMSYLSLLYPGLKLGSSSLSKLYENLGRRQTNVLAFEQSLVDNSSHCLAVDGHVIGSQSDFNDLSEKGYKFSKINEKQMNLMMAYDVNTEFPVLSKIFQGGVNDNIALVDLLKTLKLRNVVFVVDKGFYSYKNIELLSSNGNSYIIPVPSRMNIFKEAVKNSTVMERFSYQKGRKASVIEYSVKEYDGYCVYAFKDINEAVIEQENYLRYINEGNESYTLEKYEKIKDSLGVYIIQTNLMNKQPKEIFEFYKKRWKIETYYNYFKNKADYTSFGLSDYYETQGLAFVMLVSSLIYREFFNAVKNVKGKSVSDCLLDTRMVKINKLDGVWASVNTKSRTVDLFRELNTPLTLDFLHT